MSTYEDKGKKIEAIKAQCPQARTSFPPKTTTHYFWKILK